MVRTHRIVERIVTRACSAARTATTGRRGGRNRRGHRMISTTACTSTWSRLRSTAASAARGTASWTGSRSRAAASTARAASRRHGHHRSTAGTATASAGHRHHAHCWLRNSLPIIAGVDHGLVIAVHRGLGRQLVISLRFVVTTMLVSAVAARFLSTGITARLGTAVSATKFVGNFVQTRAMPTAGITT